MPHRSATPSVLDTKLAEIAAEADAAVIYLVGRDGIAIPPATPERPAPSSAARTFRTYFTKAMTEGTAQQYALGTVSGRLGLYLSRRVDSVIGPLGVVVVKVEFDDLEARWRKSGLVVLVTDADGVVLATTDPAWRFGTTRPLADETAARAALQLGGGMFSRADAARERRARADRRGALRRIDGAARSVSTRLAARDVPSDRAGSRHRDTKRTGDGAARRASAGPRGLCPTAAPAVGAGTARGARDDKIASSSAGSRCAPMSSTVPTRRWPRKSPSARRRRSARGGCGGISPKRTVCQFSARCPPGSRIEVNQPLAAIRTYAENGGRLLDAGGRARRAAISRDRLGHRAYCAITQ